MPHRIYTTSGFVVESRPYKEAGKILSIFSRDLGMVNAAAQGIRLNQSKLRYHAQDFCLAEFSLVRGRDIWRVVGAEKISAEIVPNPLFVRILTVIRRLVQGEEKNEALFETLIASHDFLKKHQPKAAAAAATAEPVIMLRILHHLGYIQSKPELAPFLADDSFVDELLEKISAPDVKIAAVRDINKALSESHL